MGGKAIQGGGEKVFEEVGGQIGGIEMDTGLRGEPCTVGFISAG